jgi:hypothetical protein
MSLSQQDATVRTPFDAANPTARVDLYPTLHGATVVTASAGAVLVAGMQTGGASGILHINSSNNLIVALEGTPAVTAGITSIVDSLGHSLLFPETGEALGSFKKGIGVLGSDGTYWRYVKTDASGHLQCGLIDSSGRELLYIQNADTLAAKPSGLGVFGYTGSAWKVLQVDAAGGVVVGGSLPAGSNALGTVGVTSLPALPTGANTIGNVGVSSLPSLPTGTNSIGKIHLLNVEGVEHGVLTGSLLSASKYGFGVFGNNNGSWQPLRVDSGGTVAVSGAVTATISGTVTAAVTGTVTATVVNDGTNPLLVSGAVTLGAGATVGLASGSVIKLHDANSSELTFPGEGSSIALYPRGIGMLGRDAGNNWRHTRVDGNGYLLVGGMVSLSGDSQVQIIDINSNDLQFPANGSGGAVPFGVPIMGFDGTHHRFLHTANTGNVIVEGTVSIGNQPNVHLRDSNDNELEFPGPGDSGAAVGIAPLGFDGSVHRFLKINASGNLEVVATDGGGSLTVDGTVAATQSGVWTSHILDGTSLSGMSVLPDGVDSKDKDFRGIIAMAKDRKYENIYFLTCDDRGALLVSSGEGSLKITDGGGSITVDGSVSVSGTVGARQQDSWVNEITDGTDKGNLTIVSPGVPWTLANVKALPVLGNYDYGSSNQPMLLACDIFGRLKVCDGGDPLAVYTPDGSSVAVTGAVSLKDATKTTTLAIATDAGTEDANGILTFGRYRSAGRNYALSVDGTGRLNVLLGNSIPAGSATIGEVNVSPLQGRTAVYFVAVTTIEAGTRWLIKSAVIGKKIKVVNYVLATTANTTVTFIDGNSVPLTGGMPLASGSVISAIGQVSSHLFETPAGVALLVTTSAGTLTGHICISVE